MTKQGQAWRRDAHQTRASKTTCVHGSRWPIMSTNTAHCPGERRVRPSTPRHARARRQGEPCRAVPGRRRRLGFRLAEGGPVFGRGAAREAALSSGAGQAPRRPGPRLAVPCARLATARHDTARHGSPRHGTTKLGMLASGHTIGENRRDSGSTGRLDGSGWLSRVNTDCIGRADCIHK